MAKFVKCGKWKVGQAYADVICECSTGDLIVCDDLNGNCVISGLPSIPDPFDIEGSPAIDNIITSSEVDGAVLTGRYLILFKDYTAKLSKHATPLDVEHSFDVDITVEYDGEIE